jgi:transcriptional repressor NrdR
VRCPRCGSTEDRVIDSRPLQEGAAIRRRRECLTCNHRFTTYEQVEGEDMRVVKKDGRCEPFDRRKLLLGLQKACEKRPVTSETIERTAQMIIEDLAKKYQGDIPTTAIGERVMERLHKIDEVAYVRFASVYRKFKDINDFIKTVQQQPDLNLY